MDLKTERTEVQSEQQTGHRKIYIDGRGQRPDGLGSGYAWKEPASGKQAVQWEDHLTNNQAEYKALLLAIRDLFENTTATVLTDSQVLYCQFNGEYLINDPNLAALLEEIRDEVRRKNLSISLRWIPRWSNCADKLLVKRERARVVGHNIDLSPRT